MICSICKKEEAGDSRRCKTCNAQYMKEYRSKKPSPNTEATIEPEVEQPQIKYVAKDHIKIHPIYNATIYASYYLTKGTELHKKALEAEKLMMTSTHDHASK